MRTYERFLGNVRLPAAPRRDDRTKTAAEQILISLPPPPKPFIDRERELKAALDALWAPPPATPADQPDRPLRGFIADYPADEPLTGELRTFLLPMLGKRLLVHWQDAEMPAADEAGATVENKLQNADVILLLISPDFLASDRTTRQVEIALRRSNEGSALVIPIIARECDWRSTPLANLRAFPQDGRAIGGAGSDTTTSTMRWLQLSEELEKAVYEWRQDKRRRGAAAAGPLVVTLVGPDGIGKFTLARKLVHEQALTNRYPDGILWLGEDDQGYPRQWLRDYCGAAGVPAPFDKSDTLDEGKFRALFAARRVLFVADRRAAFDIIPMLTQHAGQGCTVLVLAKQAAIPPPDRYAQANLAPLPADAAQEAMAAFGGLPDLAAGLITFAAGNPLLLRLAAAGANVVEPELLARIANEEFAKSNPDLGEERRKAAALMAGAWNTALRMPSPGARSGPDGGGLSALQRWALRRLVKTFARGSRFTRDDFANATVDLTLLFHLGLLEDLGPEIRLHPLLRDVVGELSDDLEPPAFAVFRDVDRPWCPEMVALPAGELLMGSPEDDKERYSDESPQHRVTIVRRFALGKYPVTFDEYDYFCAATKRDKPSDAGWGRGKRPVINISWRDSVAYCDWLSKETGQPCRLPSEAEWEYACRAGTTTRYAFDDKITPMNANYAESKLGMTTEVGSYAPNRWILYDMHGNVSEWVDDFWHDSYQGAPADGSAWTDGQRKQSSRYRVIRGGSWYDNPIFLRSADRDGDQPNLRFNFLGFRVARTLP